MLRIAGHKAWTYSNKLFWHHQVAVACWYGRMPERNFRSQTGAWYLSSRYRRRNLIHCIRSPHGSPLATIMSPEAVSLAGWLELQSNVERRERDDHDLIIVCAVSEVFASVVKQF